MKAKRTHYRSKRMSLTEGLIISIFSMILLVFIVKIEHLIELQREENSFKTIVDCRLPFELEKNRYIYGDMHLE